MTQLNQNRIQVDIVNLFTRERIVHTLLPTLPSTGDDVYVRNLGYEVVSCEWTLLESGAAEIVVFVRPQMDANENRPLRYDVEST